MTLIQTPLTGSILVIEDEGLLGHALTFDLKRKGYHAVTAGDAQSALEILRSVRIDLIISDIRMPGMDGVALLEAVRSTQETPPSVIWMTAFSDVTLEMAMSLGVENLLPKPFERRDLLDAVKKALTPLHDRITPPPSSLQASETVTTDASSVRLGWGGFFIEQLAKVSKVGEFIAFEIQNTAADAPALKGLGRVSWRRVHETSERKSGCGVEIVHLDPICAPYWLQQMIQLRKFAFIPAN